MGLTFPSPVWNTAHSATLPPVRGGYSQRRKSLKPCGAWGAKVASQVEYWNEYLTEDKVIFIFHLPDGFRRYEVKDYDNDEVLGLCEKLCDCKFESIKQMLSNNSFYRSIIR